MVDLTNVTRRSFGAMALASTAAACTPRVPITEPEVTQPEFLEGYGPIEDAGYRLPGIPTQYLLGVNRRYLVPYNGELEPNKLDVDPYAKFLYHVLDDGMAMRYPVGVGRAGRA
jgi:lipoprotein-anchoring transpeptidase ErfK/SrfK